MPESRVRSSTYLTGRTMSADRESYAARPHTPLLPASADVQASRQQSECVSSRQHCTSLALEHWGLLALAIASHRVSFGCSDAAVLSRPHIYLAFGQTVHVQGQGQGSDHRTPPNEMGMVTRVYKMGKWPLQWSH